MQMDIKQTPHQKRVEEFMRLAKQEVPEEPTLPPRNIRLLRAKLILEEALETIRGLGFNIAVGESEIVGKSDFQYLIDFLENGKESLEEIADGCADVSFVTIGCLSSCGLKDQPILEAVDQNNLEKFGPGHSWNEDGKLIKPPGHKPPDTKKLIEEQMK
jgi:predicted HAD superfamily Cof-like phosphohydrolase